MKHDSISVERYIKVENSTQICRKCIIKRLWFWKLQDLKVSLWWRFSLQACGLWHHNITWCYNPEDCDLILK